MVNDDGGGLMSPPPSIHVTSIGAGYMVNDRGGVGVLMSPPPSIHIIKVYVEAEPH